MLELKNHSKVYHFQMLLYHGDGNKFMKPNARVIKSKSQPSSYLVTSVHFGD